ncbi:MAG: hypothetical protein PHV61_04085 [Limnochordia bacterium]|nr:hypothetical protein [Limnochordia bacterium]MDD4518075.1 hypothetical protein [Limnochordia bacterium]
MSEISIKNLSNLPESSLRYTRRVSIPMIGEVYDYYWNVSGILSSGRLTCLSGDIGDGAASLSYTLAGELKSRTGQICIDGKKTGKKELSKTGIVVGYDYSGWRKRSVRSQLTMALSEGNPYGISSIAQLMKLFRLTEERLDRPLYRCSVERPPATIAIGLAQGKRIFSFPWLNPVYIEYHLDYWLGRSLSVLKDYDVWVILPTDEPRVLTGVADDVLEVQGLFHRMCAEES